MKTHKRIAAIVTSLVVAFLFILSAAPRAEAMKVLAHSGTWQSKILTGHSNKCLDIVVASKADGANTQQWDCHGGTNQNWEFVNTGSYFFIKNVNSGKYLDVAVASMANGGNVHQWSCHGGNNQKWSLVKISSQHYQIKPLHSGKCLDVAVASQANGGNVRQYSCHGGSNQSWRILFPNFVGMTLTQAQAALGALGLSPDKGVPLALSYTNIANRPDLQGKVATQGPSVGFTSAVRSVAFTVYKSGTLVPNLAYKTLAQAQAALAAVGLSANSQIAYQTVGGIWGDGSRHGKIYNQNPLPGSTVVPGTSVALTLTRVTVQFPDFRGMSRTQAQAAIEKGFLKSTFTYKTAWGRPDLNEKVFAQTPAVTTAVLEGSTVGLSVYQFKEIKIPNFLVGNNPHLEVYVPLLKSMSLVVTTQRVTACSSQFPDAVLSVAPRVGTVVSAGSPTQWIGTVVPAGSSVHVKYCRR